MPKPIQRLERPDPAGPVVLVTYDVHGNEIGRKSPTAYEIARVRSRDCER